MFDKVSVGDIMTRDIVTVRPNANLRFCSKQFIKNRVNTLLVVEGKKLIGILTSRDILWALTKSPKSKLEDIKVKDVASKKVAVIKPSADLAQAFKKMKRHKFRRLPVLSKGELVGILTIKDILKVDPSLYHDVGDLLNIRGVGNEKIKDYGHYEFEGFCDGCGSFEVLRSEGDQNLCSVCLEDSN